MAFDIFFITLLLAPTILALVLLFVGKSAYKKSVRIISIAVGLSVLLALLMNLYDSKVTADDIIASFRGLFSGTALVLAVFTLGKKRLLKWTVIRRGKVSLRALLNYGIDLEEHGTAFYEGAEKRTSDVKSKRLYYRLAEDERDHSRKLYLTLTRWHTRLPDYEFVQWLKNETKKYGIFTMLPSPKAPEAEILKQAIKLEVNMQTYYANFMRYFPDEWKKSKLEDQIREEKDHENDLRARLADLRIKKEN